MIGFHDSRATRYQDIKRIRRIPLPNENVTEFVAFLLEERTELFEMFVGQKLEKRRTPEQVFVGRFHFARQADTPPDVSRGQVRKMTIENPLVGSFFDERVVQIQFFCP